MSRGGQELSSRGTFYNFRRESPAAPAGQALQHCPRTAWRVQLRRNQELAHSQLTEVQLVRKFVISSHSVSRCSNTSVSSSWPAWPRPAQLTLMVWRRTERRELSSLAVVPITSPSTPPTSSSGPSSSVDSSSVLSSLQEGLEPPLTPATAVSTEVTDRGSPGLRRTLTETNVTYLNTVRLNGVRLGIFIGVLHRIVLQNIRPSMLWSS